MGWFFAMYLVVVLVPLILATGYYGTQINTIQDGIVDLMIDNLELNKTIIENTLRATTDLVEAIRADRGFASLLNMQGPVPADAILAIARIHELSMLTRVNDPYLLDVLVYLANPRLLFTKTDVYVNVERFYPFMFEIPGKSAQEWLDAFVGDSYIRRELDTAVVRLGNRSQRVIIDRSSLPVTQRNAPRGTVAALIDQSAIEQLMQDRLAGTHGGFAFISLPGGRIFAATGTEDFGGMASTLTLPPAGQTPLVFNTIVDGRRMVILQITSSFNDWLYVTGFPQAWFYENTQRVRVVFGVVFAIVIIAGFTLSVVLAGRLSRPLIDISNTLALNQGATGFQLRNPLRLVARSVHEIVTDRDALGALLNEQKPILRNLTVQRLFRGEFASEDELNAFLEHFGVEIYADWYGVGCVFIDGFFEEVDTDILREFAAKNVYVQATLRKLLPDRTLVHDINMNRVGFVVGYSTKDLVACTSAFEQLVGALDSHFHGDALRCIVATGGIVERPIRIAAALETAIEKINRSPTAGGGEDHPLVATDLEHFYYYPPEVESHIIEMTVAGKVTETLALVDRVRSENLEARELSVRMLKILAEELAGTRLKIDVRSTQPQGTELQRSDAGEGSGDETLVGTINCYLDGFVETARVLHCSSDRPRKIKQRLEDYLNARFSDPNTCLKQVAYEFHLSEAYLSKVFHEMFGVPFSTYLERLRIDRASELLSAGLVNVVECAQRCGYSSAASFRRAFKRHVGVSPSSLR